MLLSHSLRSVILTGAAAAAIVAPAPVAAQPVVSFDIPAQDLAGALQQFAIVTNREILFSPTLVANIRSRGLSGRFTPEEALRRLLAGTDIGFRRTGPNVFVLRRDGAPVASRTAVSSGLQDPGRPVPAPAARAGAEAGSLSGVVFDGATGTPLAGASVRIGGTGLAAVTDERGVYRFPAVAPGTYTVELVYLGEAPQSQTVAVAARMPARLDFIRGSDASNIVVVGYASAIQRALNQQLTAPNNSTVISEDLLGGFPAETVSEALRRVPGVAFGRDDETGEGSRITVRGFSSEAINVQVNGLDLQGTNFERTVDLSGYLAENISTITIHKSLLPSHEATGSGGLVEIETRSGLDYGAFHLSANIEGERAVESGFGNEWQAGATIGGRIAPNLGIVGTISYRDTDRRNLDVVVSSATPQVLPAGFTSVGQVPASRQFPFDEAFSSRLISGSAFTQRERDETNLAVSVNLAWDVADHTRLRFDAQRNEREATNFTSRATIGFIPGAFDMPIPELGGEVRRRSVLNSFRPIVGLQESALDLTTNTISLRGDTDLDRWQFRYKVGYSGARSRRNFSNIDFIGSLFTNVSDLVDPSTIQLAPDDDAAGTLRVIDGGFVVLDNGVPVPSLTPLGQDIIFDPSTYRLSTATRAVTDSPTDAWIAEASGRYEFGTWLDYVEVGFKYDRSERSALDDLFVTTGTGLQDIVSYSPIAGRSTFLSDIDAGLLLANPLGRIGLDGFASPFIGAAGNAALFDALAGLTADDPSTPFNEERFTFVDRTGLDPFSDPDALAPARSVEEKLAGYLEAHVEFGRFDVIGGARIERARRVGTALTLPAIILDLPGAQREPIATFVDAGLVDFSNLAATDTTITPSFLVNYRPRGNIVARLGYFRSTVNPSFQLLRRQTQYTIDLRPSSVPFGGAQVLLREGNPDLVPSTTDNFDFDVAYYFQDSPGLIRAGFFYKKINNNFTNVFIQDQPEEAVRQRVLDFFGPLVQSRPDLFDFQPDTEFLLSRPVNGEGGTIWGFELEVIRQFDFLPGILGGFGVIGNLTYTTADFPTLVSGRDDEGNVTNFSLDRPLEDQAAWVYNAALTYARGGFEGRLIYTRQSATATAYEIHDLNTILPSYSTLDLRLSYSFGGPVGGLYTIFLEGDDLLRDADEADIRNATSSTFGRSDDKFFFPNTLQFLGGRTITLGARVRF